jgi:hypothetical protein
MYLLYDVLQLQKSALGNMLLVKRRDWRSAMDDIASLTVEQLQDAARAAAAGQPVACRKIRRLLRDLTVIGMQVPQSHSQKLKMRSQIKGLIVRYGMPAFWIRFHLPATKRLFSYQ